MAQRWSTWYKKNGGSATSGGTSTSTYQRQRKKKDDDEQGNVQSFSSWKEENPDAGERYAYKQTNNGSVSPSTGNAVNDLMAWSRNVRGADASSMADLSRQAQDFQSYFSKNQNKYDKRTLNQVSSLLKNGRNMLERTGRQIAEQQRREESATFAQQAQQDYQQATEQLTGGMNGAQRVDYIQRLKQQKARLEPTVNTIRDINEARSMGDTKTVKAYEQYNDATQKLEELKAQNEELRRLKRIRDYSQLTQNEDFDENSTYQTTVRQGNKKDAWMNYLPGSSGEDTNFSADEEYERVNQNRDIIGRIDKNAITQQAAASGGSFDDTQNMHVEDFMSDSERAIYNYLYKTQGKKAAHDYLMDLTPDLNKKSAEAQAEFNAQLAKENPVLSSAITVLDKPVVGLRGLATQLGTAAVGGKIDPYDPAYTYNRMNTELRSNVGQNIAEAAGGGTKGELANMGYQTLMSMLDNLYGMAIGGGGSESEGIILSIMGTDAASTSMIDQLQRGVGQDRAVILGLSAGAAEVITEKIGLDNLFNSNWTGSREALKALGKQIFAEGAEEGLADLMNWTMDDMYDVLASQDQSEWKRMVAEYQNQGYTESQAFGLAIKDRMKELGLDIAGGAISGGLLGGGASIVNNVKFARSGREIKENLPENSQYQRVGDRQLGEFAANVAYTEAETRAEASEALQKAATEMAEDHYVTQATSDAILQNEAAVRELEFQTGESVRTASDVSRAVRAMQTSQQETQSRQSEEITEQTERTMPEERTATESRTVARQSAPANVNPALLNTNITEETVANAWDRVDQYATQWHNVNYVNTAAAITKNFNDNYNPAVYNKAANELVEAGLRNEAMPQTVLPLSAANEIYETARTEGRLRYVRDKSESGTGADSLRGYSGRLYGETAVEQGSGMAESTGEAHQGEGRTELEAVRGQSNREIRSSNAEQEVTARDLGIKNGTDDARVILDSKESLAPELKEISDKHESLGNNIYYYHGDSLSSNVNGQIIRSRGLINEHADGTADIYVRTDDKAYSAEQISYHESHHADISDEMRRTGKRRSQVVNRRYNELVKRHGEEFIESFFLTPYMDIYADQDMKVWEIKEEMLSDLAGGMNELVNVVSGLSNSIYAPMIQQVYETESRMFKDSFGSQNENTTGTGSTQVFQSRDVNIDQLDHTNNIVVDDNGNTVAEFQEDGSVKFSISSFENSGRKIYTNYLNRMVKKGELSQTEVDDMLSEMETIYDICKKFADTGKYAPFTAWSNADVIYNSKGKPVFSAIKKNSEYKMNVDFSTICKKRRTLDAVFREMITRGIMENLDLNKEESAAMVVNINNLIRDHGFEAACALCFVEARRYRQQQTATTFRDMWNGLVESMYKDKSQIAYFNFGQDSTVKDVPDGIHTMDNKNLNLKHLKKLANAKNEEGKLLQTAEAKAARLLLKDPSQRKLMRVGDMMASTGFENMQIQNPQLMKIYNSKKGTGGAKSSFGDVQYLNEIIRSQSFNRRKAYAVSGVRIQSFSDYVPRMVFDYVQVIADLAAKKLPAHAYTKEILFARQFGLTGTKINLSLVPDVVKDGVAPGLDANGNYIWNEEGTFPYEEAMKLQQAEGYKDNCGTIAVGISDEHIRKMLADPTIQMVIPYHKSSLNPIVASMTNIDRFTNYEDYQNTKDENGKAVSKDFEWDNKLFELSHDKNGKLLPKSKWGNVQDLVKEYVDWCDTRNYTPKFSQFLYMEDGSINPGYYKMLEDFALLDNDGNFKPQGDVQMRFPTESDAFGSMASLIEQGLSEDAQLEAKRQSEISGIVDEIQTMIDKGTIAEQNTKMSRELDSTGKRLSEGQQKYFAESKVRDENGNLKVMYHGTMSGGFTIFDPSKSDDRLSLFFTDDKEVAETYTYNFREAVPDFHEGVRGRTIYPVYLDIKNPMIIDAKGASWSRIQNGEAETYTSNRKRVGDYDFMSEQDIKEFNEKYDLENLQRAYNEAMENGTAEYNGEELDEWELDDLYTKATSAADKDYRQYYRNHANYEVSARELIENIKDYGWYDVESMQDNYDSNGPGLFEIKENADDDIETAAQQYLEHFQDQIEEGYLEEDFLDTFTFRVLPPTGSTSQMREVHNTRWYAKEAAKKGHDGVIFKNLVDRIHGSGAATIAVAFNSDQVKWSENINPSHDPDIRYSRDIDSEGRTLSEGQKAYFADAQTRYEDGSLMVLYHTTNRGGFTIFDPSKSDDKRSLFFASNFDVSQTYGNNAAKPFNFDEDTSLKSWDEVVDFFESKFGTRDAANFIMIPEVTLSGGADVIATELGNTSEERFNKWLKMQEQEDQNRHKYQVRYEDPLTLKMRHAVSLSNLVGQISNSVGLGKQVIGYYECYVNLKNPLVIDAKGANWSRIEWDTKDNSKTVDEATEEIRKDASAAIQFLEATPEYSGEDYIQSLHLTVNAEVKRGGSWQPVIIDTVFTSDLDIDDEDRELDIFQQMELALGEEGFSNELIGTLETEYEDAMDGGIVVNQWAHGTNGQWLLGGAYFDELGERLFDDEYYSSEGTREYVNTREIAKRAEKSGYDGVIIRNLVDIGGSSTFRGDSPLSDIVVAFDSNQVKDVNNQNPTEDPDIRLSRELDYDGQVTFPEDINKQLSAIQDLRAQYAELQRENQKNKERAEYFKGETKRNVYSDNPRVDTKAVDRAAKDYIKNYGLAMDQAELSKRLKSFAEDFHKGGQDFSQLSENVIPLANEIVRSAKQIFESPEKEIIDHIRKTKIQVSDKIRSDIADYGGFRKQYFGRANLSTLDGTPVEDFYRELQDAYGYSLFPEDIGNPTDQLMTILTTLDGLSPYRTESMFDSYDLASATQSVAIDLMNDVMDMAPHKTFADKQVEAREKLKKEMQEQARQAIQKVRQQRDNKIQQLKDHYREVASEKRIRKQESSDRKKLLKIAQRLSRIKTTKANRILIEEMIGELDLVAVNLTGSKEFTKSGQPAKPGMKQRLEALKTWYDAQFDDPNFLRDLGIEAAIERLEKKQISDMDIEDVRDLTNILKVFEHKLRTDNKLLRDQDRRDVFLMGQQVIEDISSGRGNKLGKLDDIFIAGTLTPERAIRRMTDYWDDDPLYLQTKKLSEGQREMISFQMKANDLFKKWTADRKYLDRIMGRKAATIKIKEGVEVTPAMVMSLYLHSLNDDNMRHIEVGGVRIPDMKRYKKGDMKDAYAYGQLVQFTRSQIRNLAETHLTENDRAALSAISDYYNRMSQEAINDVSEDLYGFSLAEVENYFPINADKDYTKNSDTYQDFIADSTIEGMGFLKDRINGANNPIMLRDAFEVLTQSINDTAKFVGLAIPVRNFKKILGVDLKTFGDAVDPMTGKTVRKVTGYENSVRDALGHRWGSRGKKYIDDMLSDLEGNSRKTRSKLNATLNKIRSNYAGAVLTLNLSVAMKQAASYPTAAAVLGWGPLAKAMGNTRLSGKVDLELIKKYTPLLYYRMQGYSTQETGDIAQSNNFMNRLVSNHKALNWIQAIDIATTKKLWKASEYYVRDNFKDLEIGTDEYYQEVANIYNQVIEETQPNYTTMQRPDLLRDDNALLQSILMFKTQPFQNFNVLFDAVGNYQAKVRHYNAIAGADVKNYNLPESRRAVVRDQVNQAKSNVKLARKKLANAISALLISTLVFASMTFAYNMLRRKKDNYEDENGEATFGAIAKGIGKDMASSAAGMVPFGAEGWELISSMLFGETYYGLNSVTITAISDFVSAGKDVFTQVEDAINTPEEERDGLYWQNKGIKLDSDIQDIANAFGIPAANVRKLFNIPLAYGLDAKGEYSGQYEYMKFTRSVQSNKAEVYDLLYGAYMNDRKQFREIYDDMVDVMGFKPETIKTNVEKRMKEEAGVSSVKDLKQRFEP